MSNIVTKVNHEQSISVCFYIEEAEVMRIGEKMEEINEEAYMNGYNWEAFLKHYLALNHLEILEGMDSDPEAGMYVAIYQMNPDNDKKADQLVNIIADLTNNPNKIYDFLKVEGESIAWD